MVRVKAPLVVDVTHFFHARSGGVRTYLAEKSRFLARHGWRHVIVVPGPRDAVGRWQRSVLVTLWSPLIPGTGGYRLLMRHGEVVARLLRVRPSLIEFGSPYLIPSMVAEAARRLGVPAVGFYHSHLPEAHLVPLLRRMHLPDGGSLRALAEVPLWAYLRRVLWALDGVVAPSRAAATELERHGAVPPGACRVVPLGVDLQRFHPERRSLAWRRAHLPEAVRAEAARAGAARAKGALAERVWADTAEPGREPVVLLYAGRLAPDKGMDGLLATWHRVRERLDGRAALWLAGDGPERDRVLRHAGPSARWLGFLEGDQLATAFASADLFLTASPSETFGLALAEAQACGLPVVAPAWGAIPEVVDPDSGVVVRLEAAGPAAQGRAGAAKLAPVVEALADGALRALANLEARRASARRFAERRFDWNRTFEALLAFYEALMERRARHAPGERPRAHSPLRAG